MQDCPGKIFLLICRKFISDHVQQSFALFDIHLRLFYEQVRTDLCVCVCGLNEDMLRKGLVFLFLSDILQRTWAACSLVPHSFVVKKLIQKLKRHIWFIAHNVFMDFCS